jgi:hypothetical protein
VRRNGNRSFTTTNASAPDFSWNLAYTYDWFTFAGFENQSALSISGPSKALALCNETPPSVTFDSTVAIGGGSYSWSTSGGLTIVGSSTNASVDVRANSSGGHESVTLTYSVGGRSVSTNATITVVKPTSLILNPKISSNPQSISSGMTYATKYFYQINDQYGQILAWPGLKASETLVHPSGCSATNVAVDEAHTISADDGTFIDTLSAPAGIAFGKAQTILVHIASYPGSPGDPIPGCVVRRNCLNYNGTEATATINSGTGTSTCCP